MERDVFSLLHSPLFITPSATGADSGHATGVKTSREKYDCCLLSEAWCEEHRWGGVSLCWGVGVCKPCSVLMSRSVVFLQLQMSWNLQYRTSKFRHVYGRPASKEKCYDCVPITHNVHDNQFCAVNPHFIAVVTECACGGAFVVIPIHQVSSPEASWLLREHREAGGKPGFLGS